MDNLNMMKVIDTPKDLLFRELEKEIIEARDKAIEMDSKNIKLERELFVVQEELNSKESDIKYYKNDIEFLKGEIYKLQQISEDLAGNLRVSNEEVKYWYKQKTPTFKTVLKNWIKKVKKNATNYIERFKTPLWAN